MEGTVTECFSSDAVINLSGTGALAGYSEQLTLPIFTEVVSNRGPGDPTPSFGTEMMALSGELPPGGSANFCFLAISAGSQLAGPRLGQVDLTPLPGGKFQVDSFFDVSYRITYSGCPGSILDGLSGVSDLDTVHVEAFGTTLIPAVSQWGLIVFGTLMLTAMAWTLWRRQSA